MNRRNIAGGLAVFVVIGAQQALYGPAIPALREQFHLSAASVAVALSAHFVGGLLGVGAFIPARRRFGDGVLLSVSTALITLGCLGFLFAPTWPVALLAAFVGGLGFGGIDGGINQVFTELYAERSHGVLNFLHGAFGAGAIAGPLLVAAGYHVAFAICAVGAAVSIPLLVGMQGDRVPHDRRVKARFTPIALLWLAFFLMHVGLETGAGGWAASHLAGHGTAVATAAASGFWFAFTASRFVAAPLSRRFSARGMTLCCAAATVVAAAATPLGVPAYLALGAAVGPLFPTGLAWLAGSRPQLTPYVVSISMLGGVAVPPVIGVAVEFVGVTAIPASLVVLALGCCATGLLLGRRAEQPGAADSPTQRGASPLSR